MGWAHDRHRRRSPSIVENELTNSGNVDLTHVLFFLGNTQLQILSFLTSFLLATAHFSTSWAVTERILLRDE